MWNRCLFLQTVVCISFLWFCSSLAREHSSVSFVGTWPAALFSRPGARWRSGHTPPVRGFKADKRLSLYSSSWKDRKATLSRSSVQTKSGKQLPEGGGIEFVEGSTEVAATPEECFQIASNFEDYVKWADSVPKVEVQEKDEDGLGKLVALQLGALGFTLDYNLEYEYDRPQQMSWKAVGGCVTTPLGVKFPFEGPNLDGSNQLVGSYTFEEVREGVTRVTYKLAIEYGFPFPKAVKDESERQIVSTALEELKKYTERPSTKASLRSAPPSTPPSTPTPPLQRDGSGSAASSTEEAGRERERVKGELLAALEGLDRGFEAGAAERARVAEIVQRLAALSPEARPAEALLGSDSEWRLIYSDAPDIVGPTAAGRGRIGQRVEAAAGRIVNLVEAAPPSPLRSLPVAPPSLELEVELGAEAVSAAEVRLSLQGTRAYPTWDTSLAPLPLPSLPLSFPLLLPLPFGSFTILYYDGEMRVIQTAQGYLGVNLRER